MLLALQQEISKSISEVRASILNFCWQAEAEGKLSDIPDGHHWSFLIHTCRPKIMDNYKNNKKKNLSIFTCLAQLAAFFETKPNSLNIFSSFPFELWYLTFSKDKKTYSDFGYSHRKKLSSEPLRQVPWSIMCIQIWVFRNRPLQWHSFHPTRGSSSEQLTHIFHRVERS